MKRDRRLHIASPSRKRRLPSIVVGLVLLSSFAVPDSVAQMGSTFTQVLRNSDVLAKSQVVLQNSPPRMEPGTTTTILLGAGLGAGGLLVTGLLSTAIWNDCPGEDGCLVQAILTMYIGESIGMSIGSHLGNGRQGSLAADILVSLIVPALAFTAFSGVDENMAWILTPIVQLGTTSFVEIAIGRSRSNKKEASVAIVAGPAGGVGIGLRLRR